MHNCAVLSYIVVHSRMEQLFLT